MQAAISAVVMEDGYVYPNPPAGLIGTKLAKRIVSAPLPAGLPEPPPVVPRADRSLRQTDVTICPSCIDGMAFGSECERCQGSGVA
jgi:hypothetical protein